MWNICRRGGERRLRRTLIGAAIATAAWGSLAPLPAAATPEMPSQLAVEIPYLGTADRTIPADWEVTECPVGAPPNLVHLSCTGQRIRFTATGYVADSAAQTVDVAFAVDGSDHVLSYEVTLGFPRLDGPASTPYGFPLAQGTPVTIPFIELAASCAACTDTGPTYFAAHVDPPAAGRATFSGLGLVFAPSPDFTGTATLSFRVRDPTGQETARARIPVSVVAGRSHAPSITPNAVAVGPDEEAHGNALRDDIQEPEVETELDSCSEAANGTVRCSPDGSFVYTPDPGFIGVDEFAYHLVTSSTGDQAVGSVVVGIGMDPTTVVDLPEAGEMTAPFTPPRADPSADVVGVLDHLRQALTRITVPRS
ncbi:hypothetical protein SAMN06295974_3130 [Plantibacter flavus]|uniref:Uncharacterized protein n=1 Tax=Plantibacter flavus TaxID=150123 RepID=A0A3N2C3Y3_9MICO|nr:Ig-like domain-containing protein [Plantibacter flavus]ROR82237.1 hypothetical protein EDD42_2325 [Plantibacter flavus]SMG42595.1 hypothetical protein SAMN06295974_3130 [Plantibacter flavus]